MSYCKEEYFVVVTRSVHWPYDSIQCSLHDSKYFDLDTVPKKKNFKWFSIPIQNHSTSCIQQVWESNLFLWTIYLHAFTYLVAQSILYTVHTIKIAKLQLKYALKHDWDNIL